MKISDQFYSLEFFAAAAAAVAVFIMTDVVTKGRFSLVFNINSKCCRLHVIIIARAERLTLHTNSEIRINLFLPVYLIDTPFLSRCEGYIL